MHVNVQSKLKWWRKEKAKLKKQRIGGGLPKEREDEENKQ
jgi:hypothetical protein